MDFAAKHFLVLAGARGLSALDCKRVGIAYFWPLVEKRLGSRHALQLFFISAIGAPLIFTFFIPTIQLAGASSGIAGLIASSLALEPKKSVLALIALLLLIGGNVAVLTTELNSQTAKPPKPGRTNPNRFEQSDSGKKRGTATAIGKTIAGTANQA